MLNRSWQITDFYTRLSFSRVLGMLRRNAPPRDFAEFFTWREGGRGVVLGNVTGGVRGADACLGNLLPRKFVKAFEPNCDI